MKEKPRGKMGKFGPDKLTSEELLALVLELKTKGVNARTLVSRIAAFFFGTRS